VLGGEPVNERGERPGPELLKKRFPIGRRTRGKAT
jgi:hypothetical protein